MAGVASGYWWTPGRLVGREERFLRVRNRDLIDINNKPWQFRGYHVHYALNAMWPSIHKLDLDGVFDEMIELGANTMITMGMHASPWKRDNGWSCTPIEHPDFYSKLGKLFDKAEDRKTRIWHNINVDMQHLPKNFDRARHFRESCAVMAGRELLFASKGNEMDHNGWHQNDPMYQFPDMRGVLCCQGTIGEDVPPRLPYLDICVHSLRTDLPKMFVDAPLRQVMDGDFMQENGKRGVPTNRPTISMEPIRFNDVNPDHVGDDDRSTDPRVALELGWLTGGCAGGAIAFSYGMECRRLLPHARYIAEEYFRGLTAGFVRPLAGLDFQGAH